MMKYFILNKIKYNTINFTLLFDISSDLLPININGTLVGSVALE